MFIKKLALSNATFNVDVRTFAAFRNRRLDRKLRRKNLLNDLSVAAEIEPDLTKPRSDSRTKFRRKLPKEFPVSDEIRVGRSEQSGSRLTSGQLRKDPLVLRAGQVLF